MTLTVSIRPRRFAGRPGFDVLWRSPGSRTSYRLWQPSRAAANRLREALAGDGDPWDALTAAWCQRPPTEAPYRHNVTAAKLSWSKLTPEERERRIRKIQASRRKTFAARKAAQA